MKALIVAESESVLLASQNFLLEQHCDVIKYRWLMKALDNLEEIDPQIIIISAMDYPRHWKTLVQFINSTFPAKLPHIYLFSSDVMGENEIRKAKWLGVKGVIKDFSSFEDRQMLSSIFTQKNHPLRLTAANYKKIPSQQMDQSAGTSDTTVSIQKSAADHIPVASDAATESSDSNHLSREEKKAEHKEENNQAGIIDVSAEKKGIESGTCFSTDRNTAIHNSEPVSVHEDSLKIMFSNPHTLSMITGKVLLTKGNTILYICDNISALEHMKTGDMIPNCCIKQDGKIYKKSVKINELKNCNICMEIQEWP